MSNLLEEIKLDVNFVKSHSLQPKWYKVLKVVMLAGFVVGYGYLFGLARTAVFLVSFLLLSLAVHLTYRARRSGSSAVGWTSWSPRRTASGWRRASAGTTMRQSCSTRFSQWLSARRCRWAERR